MESPQLSNEASIKLQEGINLLLSRWSSLQVAVENEFGGRDSRERSKQLPITIFSWFTQSRGLFTNSCIHIYFVNMSNY